MDNISKIFLLANSTIEDALNVIDSGAVKIALVIDKDKKLLGTLGDGDIRRALLRKNSLKDTINSVYFKSPITAKKDSSKDYLLNLCSINSISQIPIVDENNKVIDLFIMGEGQAQKKHNNRVFLMVGGLGVRLRPLTEKIPKPMLLVGGKPILEWIVKRFVDCGFTNITMCLGYKSKTIKDHFCDGSKFRAKIDYIDEKERMGTAGALTLFKKKEKSPFFVMNGDLLTNVDFEKMIDFHEECQAMATMCIREYDIEVPYGVVNISGEHITSIEEKPIHNFFVNAGIYLLEPDCINLIPNNKFYDMPTLFEKLLARKDKIVSFPLQEYWLDVGKLDDYKRANSEILKEF